MIIATESQKLNFLMFQTRRWSYFSCKSSSAILSVSFWYFMSSLEIKKKKCSTTIKITLNPTVEISDFVFDGSLCEFDAELCNEFLCSFVTFVVIVGFESRRSSKTDKFYYPSLIHTGIRESEMRCLKERAFSLSTELELICHLSLIWTEILLCAYLSFYKK